MIKYELKKSIKMPYITVSIYDDGSGEIDLSDPMGWYSSGGRDSFLLNLIRIKRSSVFNDFKNSLHESVRKPNSSKVEGEPILKEDIIQAINYSLLEDPSDGLYGLLGDNRSAYDYDDFMSSRQSDEEYEIKNCFEDNFIEKQTAEYLAETIAEKAGATLPDEKDVKDELIKELRDEFHLHHPRMSWKDFIAENIKKCDVENDNQKSPFFRYKENDAAGFIDCLTSIINDYHDDAEELYYESCTNAFYEKWGVDDEFLKNLSEEKGIPFEILTHCSHGGTETLEKYRPIKENQTFLESYGVDIPKSRD
jgi:hypothetical protein